ncbi:DNA topoisomerase [Spironucleus salmonicida]|uniref:DNA topoisomerase n=1 Tax=Spironucleus salmonicida TaxID=348837 RepID=V6M7K9_9EUKA|nr:DNA topoisomerase [Spironucleus salmonicida]|eukprot:EST49449.1 DNA topoisomerase [Spironucleus salmonicida]
MTTLFISEKPSIAQSIARLLSPNVSSQSSSSTPVYSFPFSFKQAKQAISTSVAGHLYQIIFNTKLQSWQTPEEELLEQKGVEYETTKGAGGIIRQLQALSKNAKYIILALDNDREGENICFEVLKSIGKFNGDIFRLRFSALTKEEITRQLGKVDKPNQYLSDAVEVRQELDLKVGVAFTRFQTQFLSGKYSNLQTNCISYGPCQTPTLAFCVERHLEILNFKPKRYYNVDVQIKDSKGNIEKIDFISENKIFEQDMGLHIIKQLNGGKVKVISIKQSKSKSVKPIALNTVAMLKLASTSLNMSPQESMYKAEFLYLQGYLTYPRTESTSYPKEFNFMEVIKNIKFNYAYDAIETINKYGAKPRSGVDAGDHPPITPTSKCAQDLSGMDLSFYNMICKNFLASLMPDAEFYIKTVELQCEQHKFHVKSKEYITFGWQILYKQSDLADDEQYEVTQISYQKDDVFDFYELNLKEKYTTPPTYLTESNLLSLMEKNLIGTDASMAQHIQNVQDRNYVQLLPGKRQLQPTQLGIQLIQGLKLIDKELVAPNLRSKMEQDLNKVAEGKISKVKMINEQLTKYLNKFQFFKQNINLLDQLFESKFQTIKSAGKPFISCPQCNKFTKFISLIPQRIYCGTCDRIYSVIQCQKHYEIQKIRCAYCNCPPISAAGEKRTNFCPKCYTDGNEDMVKDLEEFGYKSDGKGLTCNQCMNQSCPLSLRNNYISDCPACSKGGCDKLILGSQTSAKIEEKFKITIDEFDIQIEKPVGKSEKIQQQIYLQSKLYLDNFSIPSSSQITCTSCQATANLPQGQPLILGEFCECGARKIEIKTKEGLVTGCGLCSIEGVEIKMSSEKVSWKSNNNNRNGRKGQTSGHKDQGSKKSKQHQKK